ncbi:prepilin peptidase [Agromyces sp. NPDC058110]|uniref:prepilin peptidase n=1 Tax=Agromyces sp. NPDC058110 TaxID=3346345 RepID=UPI0036DA7252
MPSAAAASISFAVLALLLTAFGAALGWWSLSALVQRALRTPAGIGEERMPRRTVRVLSAAITGVTFGLLGLRFGAWPLLPALLVFAAGATVLALVDLIEHRLPNTVVFTTLGVVAVFVGFASLFTARAAPALYALGGAAAMFAVYLLLALISPGAMGMGDVKLALLIGFVLGWFGLTAWLIGLLGAFVIGGVIAIVGLAARRVTLRGSIPFGPSMLAGAIVALVLVGPPSVGG